MNLEKLNDWLTLAANIGVIVGIFALVAELNHSSRIAEATAFQTRMSEIQEATVQLSLSADLPVILSKLENEGVSSLNEVELMRAAGWHNGVIRRMQSQYFQYQQGFLDRRSIDNTLDGIARDFYHVWEDLEILNSIEIPEWREEIQERVASASGT
jgi:hypothetical protein